MNLLKHEVRYYGNSVDVIIVVIGQEEYQNVVYNVACLPVCKPQLTNFSSSERGNI